MCVFVCVDTSVRLTFDRDSKIIKICLRTFLVVMKYFVILRDEIRRVFRRRRRTGVRSLAIRSFPSSSIPAWVDGDGIIS